MQEVRGWRAWRRRCGAGLVVLGLWLALTGAAAGLMPVGLVLAAAVLALDPRRVWPGLRLPHPMALSIYLPGFVLRSFLGGVDVALRVFDPRLPIRPGFRRHSATAQGEAVRATHMAAISLLPGSLGAGSDADGGHVHVLTDEPRAIAAIEAEERRIRRVFGEGGGG